jgi:tetratricopeptide (TPR) repeat protein
VDGTLTAREVLDMAPVSIEEAERSLFGLLSIGMLEFVEGAPARPAPAAGTAAARARILEAHGRVGTRDHFEVLGVARSASPAEVKAAFLRLAKEFHPDVHHQPALSDLRDRLTAVFARITEAHGILSDPATRAGYEAERRPPEPVREPRIDLKPEPVAPPPPVDPGLARQHLDEAVTQAEEHFAAGQYWEVLQLLHEGLLSNVQGRAVSRARTLRAQCHLKNPEAQKQAESELKLVVAQDPGFPEAYFLLGAIYRAGGASALAASMFRKVLELKPRHAGAREELAAMEGAPLPNPGLLGRLLRRN